MRLQAVWALTKETFTEWQKDKIPLWAAALAYYTIFSLAPVLIIAIAITGLVFGQDAAQGQIVGQIQGLVGRQGAEAIQGMIENAYQPATGTIATIISIITLLLGASGVFAQLQDALNTIWEVEPQPGQGIKTMVQKRFLSFAMVLVIGFLLLVSLVLTAALAAVSAFLGHLLPGFAFLWELLNFVVSFAVVTLLFGMIYRILPDIKIPWSDVWLGAAVAALLFSIGRWLIGLYLGQSAVGSTYGAAGSLVIILIWVFYSAQILLIGAEFTHVYAQRHGSLFRRSQAEPVVTTGETPRTRRSH